MRGLKRKKTVTALYTFSHAPERDGERVAAVQAVLTADGRRVVRNAGTFVTPPSPTKRSADVHDLNSMHVADDESFLSGQSLERGPTTREDEGERHQLGPESSRRKSKAGPSFATMTHDPALLRWADQRQMYLEENIRLEGLRGASSERCTICQVEGVCHSVYTCVDCFGSGPTCRQCCVKLHARCPFHRIKRWNGQYSEPVTLKDLGLVIQLGHPVGEPCAAPVPAPRNFLVMDTNGFHPVNLLFCQCDRVHASGNRTQQLLRSELWGATTQDPTTCCTLAVLDHFHTMTLQSKINAYDYYMTLEKLTDNTGLSAHRDRLKPFLRMVREYRHLKMLKRGGRGHDPGGVAATTPGDLCVRCPACPRPGFNLPDNWDEISDDMKFIYTMFIAVDANFRLKRRAVSNETRDPALGSGWGYFVEDKDYREHLAHYVDQDEICTCTGLAALLQANTRWSKGYAATGVGMACCSRHGFILPNGVGDLQRGERYCNMDYIWLSVLKLLPVKLQKVLSYDIMCQWAKNLAVRVANFPHHLFVSIPLGPIRYVIPKYHFRGHREEDHNQFSLNLLPGVGRTDGEEIERNWSRHDATSASTREMGPGSRFDTLEDHFGWANWQRLEGVILRNRLRRAITERGKYQQLFDDFAAEIAQEKKDLWIKDVIAWEKDPKNKDPYFQPPSGMTESDIRLKLAQEDDEDAASGRHYLHDVTPGAMIMELLDIEDQQRKFRAKFCRGTTTTTQSAYMLEKRTALRRRLQNVRAVQAIYMPGAAALLATHLHSLRMAKKPVDEVEYEPLLLPSSVDDDMLQSCEPGLADVENRLRDGQLRDSLDKTRVQLHIKSRLVAFKARNVRHQGANTRANKKLQDNEAKIQAFAQKYRDAWTAKAALVGNGDWQREWRALKSGDVRCMKDDDPTVGRTVSEGRRAISWIWMAAGTSRDGQEAADLPGMDDALRVEFLRSRSRSGRFTEEVHLLTEEQRRTLVSLEEEALEWDRRREAVQSIECPILREGSAAYAAKQAALRRGLAAKFHAMWTDSKTASRDVQKADTGHGAEAEERLEDDDGEIEYTYIEDSDEELDDAFDVYDDGVENDVDDEDGEPASADSAY